MKKTGSVLNFKTEKPRAAKKIEEDDDLEDDLMDDDSVEDEDEDLTPIKDEPSPEELFDVDDFDDFDDEDDF